VDNNLIYLDYAAATPLDPEVKRVMEPYFCSAFYNPSSPYEPARQVKRDISQAREAIARLIGAKPTEIIFTAGATESINLAFHRFNNIAYSAIEHPSVRAAAGDKAAILPVDRYGRLSLLQLAQSITDDVELVSVGLVNNEIGTIQNLKSIAQLIAEKRKKRTNQRPLWLHTDASQAPGMVEVNVQRLGVDMMTLNSAKIYGPKQMGLLWVRTGIELSPLILGGGQEQGVRAGTENAAAIIGFSRALELAEKRRKSECARLKSLRDIAKHRFIEAFPDCVISGHPKHVASHILHVSFPGLDAERVVFALEMRGILVATGAACAANRKQDSYVLDALNVEKQFKQGSLRLSFGRETTKENLERAVTAIIQVIKKEQFHAS
jgi:cysteine desulfurase